MSRGILPAIVLFLFASLSASASDVVLYKYVFKGDSFNGQTFHSFQDQVVLNNNDEIAFVALIAGNQVVLRGPVDNQRDSRPPR